MTEHPAGNAVRLTRRARLSKLGAPLLGLVTILGAGLVAPAGAAPVRAMASTVFVKQVGAINDIECTSTRCLMLGTNANGNAVVMSLGPASGAVHVLSTGTTSTNNLSAIACATASLCLAAGGGATSGVAQALNGTSGAFGPNALVLGTHNLTRVTCPSATECWAAANVGNYPHFTSAFIPMSTSGLPVRVIPGPKGFGEDITCTGPSTCLGVALVGKTSTVVLLHTSGIVAEHPASQIFSLSCATTSSCYGIGLTSLVPVNGATGVAKAAIPLPGFKQMQGISCPSPTKCIALGFTQIGANTPATASAFTVISGGKPGARVPVAAAKDAFMNGLACATPTECWAVGNSPRGGLVTRLAV